MKLLRRFLGLSLVTAFGLFGLLYSQFTPVLAGICPACFGLSKAADGIWTDRPDLAHSLGIPRMVTEAHRDVQAVFGPQSSKTRVLACFTNACSKRLGAVGPRGIAYGHFVVKLSPFGIDPTILRHEFVHVARARQIGIAAMTDPAREEGLAEWIAKGPMLARDCPPSTPLPKTAREWRRTSATDRSIYARAHCAMSRRIEIEGLASVLHNGG